MSKLELFVKNKNLNSVYETFFVIFKHCASYFSNPVYFDFFKVFISVLFIACQSVKIVPDIYDMLCEKVMDYCTSHPIIDTITR